MAFRQTMLHKPGCRRCTACSSQPVSNKKRAWITRWYPRPHFRYSCCSSGDLHEGMTAFSSPPATYGESPQWLVQLLLTRSPPFATGSARPKPPKISQEGFETSLKRASRNALSRRRKVDWTDRSSSHLSVCVVQDQKARQKFTSFCKNIVPTPPNTHPKKRILRIYPSAFDRLTLKFAYFRSAEDPI